MAILFTLKWCCRRISNTCTTWTSLSITQSLSWIVMCARMWTTTQINSGLITKFWVFITLNTFLFFSRVTKIFELGILNSEQQVGGKTKPPVSRQSIDETDDEDEEETSFNLTHLNRNPMTNSRRWKFFGLRFVPRRKQIFKNRAMKSFTEFWRQKENDVELPQEIVSYLLAEDFREREAKRFKKEEEELRTSSKLLWTFLAHRGPMFAPPFEPLPDQGCP